MLLVIAVVDDSQHSEMNVSGIDFDDDLSVEATDVSLDQTTGTETSPKLTT